MKGSFPGGGGDALAAVHLRSTATSSRYATESRRSIDAAPIMASVRPTNLRSPSLIGLVVMIAGVIWLVQRHELLARSVPALAVQCLAVCLMIAARLTF